MAAGLLMVLACFVIVFTIIPAHDVQTIEQFFNLLIMYSFGVGFALVALVVIGGWIAMVVSDQDDEKTVEADEG